MKTKFINKLIKNYGRIDTTWGRGFFN
ncbi:DUF3696 domain-containing protein [Enterococcus ureasiticus]|nr:DUF3696 domain-containing protein [Enterococcus ureasiticus]